MPTRRILAIVIFAPFGVSSLRAEEPEDRVFRAEVASLVKGYCAECHSGERPKSGLDLSQYADARSVQESRKTWDRVREALEVGTMPPDEARQPPPDEVDRAVSWIRTRLETVDCQIQPDPGRVTLRRLNRAEYRNTVRDLVGVDYEPTEDFPSDDVGYGFDNIGDVLTLPPLLMERYLAAAETIAERAIVDDNPPRPRVKNLFVDPNSPGSPPPRGKSGLVLASTRNVGLDHEIAAEGDYKIHVQAYGDQAGPDPAKMAFLVDGREVGRVEVKAEGDFRTYEASFHAEPGRHRFEVRFLNDYYQPDDPDPTRRDRNLIVRRNFWEVVGPLVKDPDRLPESHRRIVFRKPRSYDDVDAIRDILGRLASRAYRRPATAEDVTRLLRLVELARQDGDRIEVGLRVALQAVLVSPHFLFRVELDPEGGQSAYDVDNFELASRISYFLWSSMPDDELLDLAKAGNLHSPGTLDAQAARLLRDPRALALTENFAAQWLQLRKLRDLAPDIDRFPAFDEPLRQAMSRETELFFDAIVREDRSILDLLDSDFTFVNDRLAAHYGLPGVSGSEFRRVALPDDRRGGVLTQASILAVTSNPTRTSPVKRGKWVLEQLLGSPPPPPPPDVPELAESKDALTGTLRQRMEQHRANPSCASCHAKMDPLGFGLENFDAIGAWRIADGDNPIDASGVLPGGQNFDGPAGLRDVLKSKDREFTCCLTAKLLTYALGRGLEDADQCVVDQIAHAVAADGHRFSRLVREIVASEPFRKRQVRKAGTP